MDIAKRVEKYTKVTRDGYKYFEFDNLYSFAELLADCKGYSSDLWTEQIRKLESEKTGEDGIDQGTGTYDEALHLLKYGWEYGAKKLNIPVHIQPTKKSLKLSYGVVGGQVSVPRMLQGLPTNMVSQKLVNKPHKILNVYKSAGYSGSYTESEIVENSIKAVQVVELLESKGYRVNLYVVKLNVTTATPDAADIDEVFYMKIKIKGASERLNIKKMAFCLANPAFQRRLLWKLIEAAPWLKGGVWRNYGRPVDVLGKSEKWMSNAYKKYIDTSKKNTVFLPIVIDNVEYFVENLKLEDVKISA